VSLRPKTALTLDGCFGEKAMLRPSCSKRKFLPLDLSGCRIGQPWRFRMRFLYQLSANIAAKTDASLRLVFAGKT
jgi:hypothetical protein